MNLVYNVHYSLTRPLTLTLQEGKSCSTKVGAGCLSIISCSWALGFSLLVLPAGKN